MGSGRPLDVLLVEPYFAGSHRSWAEGYQRHSMHRVRLVTHEGNFWRWRLRGASLTLAQSIERDVRAHGRPDVVFVSDMVNVAALLGLTRRTLGDVPVGLYLHENQLVYPPPPPRGDRPNRRNTSDPDEAGLVNWVSLAAADAVFVNSEHHRTVLCEALPRLLSRAPDHSHADSLAPVVDRIDVLPVGVEVADLVATSRPATTDPPLILWNQRWEHDKDPETFLAAVRELSDEGVPFSLALAGENVRVDPQEFDLTRRHLGDRVVHVGHLPEADYRALLRRSDVVVSTARHEYFGVAVVEAMAAGAVPLLPRRLSYPELVPAVHHDAVLYDDGELVDRLRAVLLDLAAARRRVEGLRDVMLGFDWQLVARLYDAALATLTDQYGRRP
jgi:glycosyltransferase involved in cell wall biosynthesis